MECYRFSSAENAAFATPARDASSLGTRFPNEVPRPKLVAAIVDRVTCNAHILEIGTHSDLPRTSKHARRRAR